MKKRADNTALKNVAREMAAVAEYLWHKGWAERNAGNMSVNVSHCAGKEDLGKKPLNMKLEKAFPGLEGQFLMLSGSGTRMRDLAKKPMDNTCLVKIGRGGEDYLMKASGKTGLLPTSELPTHLAIHQKLLQEGRSEKAVLHTHVNELIALTQIKPYTGERAINELLWGMHPETILFLPDGAGFVPYTLPGTQNIAVKTLEALEDHRLVIWEKHGCLAIGESLFDAFDQIDILAKSAGIFFMCRNAGFDPEGLSKTQLEDIRKHYQI
jgi:rhamnulose-1-phosphate aldolase